jgi:putative aldouronate transport system permease protein
MLVTNTHKQPFIRQMMDQRWLLLLSVPFVLWLIVFRYIPLAGWIMAFQDYKPHLGIFDQKWMGLKHFQDLFKARLFYQSLQNTLGMSFLGLIFGFTTSIGFAVLLNELRFLPFKRFTQTVSYLPHFVSWVVAANIVTAMLALSGPVNGLLISMKIVSEPINFMVKPELFWWIVVLADVWKEMGWGAIIYLAAMTGIDSQIYEAAEIDGVTRWQKIWHVTLPGIIPTIVILLVLSIGNIINVGFERQLLLGNAIVFPKGVTLDWYALRYGIEQTRYSFGTAIGIFRSGVSIILLFLANYVARKTGVGRVF